MFRTLATVLMITTIGVFSAFGCGWETSLYFPGASFEGSYVELLRSQGAEGLQDVLRKYDELQSEIATTTATTTDEEKRALLNDQLQRCQELADEVAGQYHATTSRLFWHTDLELAKRKAAEEGKPILSLRMLGKLTDQYSCANSRFFRTALYAN